MQKIRINDLARELEVKSKAILDALIKVGVTEKKTHSSSIEVDEAERVKKYFEQHAEPGTSRASRAPADEFKPKLDLSHISKPGDVLKAVTQRAAQPSAVARRRYLQERRRHLRQGRRHGSPARNEGPEGGAALGANRPLPPRCAHGVHSTLPL